LIINAKADSYAILNLDDEYSSSLIDKTKAQVITYSLKEEFGNFYCKDLVIAKGRATFTVVINKPYEAFGKRIEKDEFQIVLGVPGYHSVANAMAAIAIAITDGIQIDVIKEALLYFNGVERRFQYIYENDFVIIDDHFANKGNINVTLETLRHMDYNKLHLVYAIRGNRGVTVNRENAETVVAWKDRLRIDEIIVTKSSEVVTSKDLVTSEEEIVFNEVMNKTDIIIHKYDRLDEAIKHALDKVEKDDIIMLAGCQGMDHGGKVALDYLHVLKPEIPKEELYKPIMNRVVE
jgi:UDP-N-acetylmuramoyl-L-alanyl-D-glutamate--2,6-diaminopimelate ligase